MGIRRRIRKYSLAIEGDSTGYSAYVPQLPAILVTGKSIDELEARVKDAIRVYLQRPSATLTLSEIEAQLPY